MSDSTKRPLVLVHPKAHEKIEHWVDKATGEVSWVGEVELCRLDGRLTAYVADVDLLKQWCTGSRTYIDPVWMDKWMADHGYVDGVQTPAMNLYWGHSHVNMGVFWSGTDEDCVKSFLNFTGRGLLASVVYNKKEEWKARLDHLLGVAGAEEQWTLEADMDVQGVDYGTKAECEKQLAELVTQGMAPQRDLSDPRLAALEEEDRQKRYSPTRRAEDGWRPIGGARGGAGAGAYADGWGDVWNEEEVAAARAAAGGHAIVGDGGKIFTFCAACPSKMSCASPVMLPSLMGCHDREKLVTVTGLKKEHWAQVKQRGRTKELQAWRDRTLARIREAVKKGPGVASGNGVDFKRKMCTGRTCTTWLYERVAADEGYYQLGLCKACCEKEGIVVKRVENGTVELDTLPERMN